MGRPAMWQVDKNELKYTTKWGLMFNFCMMSIAFSVNHGCVTALIAVASTVESKLYSGLVNGTLYTTYTLSSLLLANATLSKLGSKWTIFIGLLFYCGYSGSFLISYYTKGDAQLIIAVVSTAIAGVGGGLLWTAQASFFNSSAKHWCKLTGVPFEKATSLFTAVFTAFYLGCEVILKVSLSARGAIEHRLPLFLIFTALSVGSALMMLIVRSVALPGDQVKRIPMCEKVVAAGRIAGKEPKIALLAPYNFTFSFGAAFINQYSNSHIVNKEYVGYYAALIATAGFLSSSGFGWLNERTSVGKRVPMVIGSMCFIFFSACFLTASDEQLKADTVLVVFMYIAFGCGRGVWESTMKAVFADYFGGDSGFAENETNAAFSHIPIQNGLMGASGFFLLATSDSPRSFAPQTLLAIAIIGIVTYLVADMIHKSEQVRRYADLAASGEATALMGSSENSGDDEDALVNGLTPTFKTVVQSES